MATTLNVTSHTTLTELQSFMERLDDKDKIRGRVEKDGTTTLYASSKQTGKWDWLASLFGMGRKQKQEAGERAIETVLSKAAKTSPGVSEAMVRNIMKSAPRTDGGKGLRAEDVRKLMTSFGQEQYKTLEFEGKPFKQVKNLGMDGMGVVDLYKSEEDGQLVVVKRPKLGKELGLDQDREDVYRAAMQSETDVHYHVVGAGEHPNVLGVLGDMKGPNGERMLVLPLAPKGDSHELGSRMRDGMHKGTLTLEDARPVAYTMLRDVGSSLQHLHGKAGVLHLDMKAENYLVGSDGHLKLMDFGTGRMGLEHNLDKYPVENFNYMTPEIANLYDRKVQGDPELSKKIATLNNELRELRKEKPQSEDKIQSKVKELATVKKQQQDYRDGIKFPVGPKVDSWAMGVMAFGLLVDDGPMGNPFVGENSGVTKDRLLELAKSGKSLLEHVKEWKPELAGRIDSLTGAERDLINGLLNADPGKRLTVDQAMESEVFRGPDVGSDETRRKLVELTGR